MEYIHSFFQNIKDKISNPFFGTLFFVLLIHHWEFWYTLINFNDDFPLNCKLNVLNSLVQYNFTWSSFRYDILCALFFSIVGYLIVVITRSISIFIEFTIMPLITDKLVNKNVVLKTLHDEIVVERNEYSEKYEEQRKIVRLLSTQYDQQLEQIRNKDDEDIKKSKLISELSEKVSFYETEINLKLQNIQILEQSEKEAKKELSEIKNSSNIIIELNNNLTKDIYEFKNLFNSELNENFYSNLNKFPPVIINKVIELKKKFLWNEFMLLCDYLENGGTYNVENYKIFTELQLVKNTRNGDKLSPIGYILSRFRKLLSSIQVAR